MKSRKIMAYLLVMVMVLSMMMGVPKGAAKVEAAGTLPTNMTINGSTAASGTGYSYDANTKKITVSSATPLTISSYTTRLNNIDTAYIYVEKDVSANLILNNIRITGSSGGIVIADDSTGTVTITLANGTTNRLTGTDAPAIQKNGTNGKLIINGTGKLICTSNNNDAAFPCGVAVIGGTSGNDSGNIEIAGGDITVTNNAGGSTEAGAGIGGGHKGAGTDITVSGGTVTVSGLNAERTGAAIGGGYGGSARNIKITGGTVKATAGGRAAAIGTGTDATVPASGIDISGGAVTAIGSGKQSPGIGTGFIVGGDYYNQYTEVTISGGTVTATGTEGGPGIGSGNATSVKVYISGGSVKATGDGEAEDIGLGSPKGDEDCTSNIYHSKTDLVEVKLKTDAITCTANENVDGKLIFTDKGGNDYDYGTTDMKADASGILYLYLEEGVTVEKTNADKTPPTINSVALSGATTSSLTYSMNFGESCKYVGLLLKDGESVPTNYSGFVSAVSQYSGRSVSGAGSSKSGTFTGLEAGTKYTLYVCVCDDAGNEASKNTTATTKELDKTPPTINSATLSNVTANSMSYSLSFGESCKYVALLLKDGESVPTNYSGFVSAVSQYSGRSVSETASSKSGTFSNLEPGTKYTLYVRVSDDAGNEASKNTTATTQKGTLTFSGISAQNGTYNGGTHKGYSGTYKWLYNGQEVSVALTTVTYTGTTAGGVSYNSTALPIDAGTYTATFTVTDNQYEGTGTRSFEIAKASYDMSNVKWYLDGVKVTDENNVVLTEDGQSHSVTVGVLPSGVNVNYSNNTASTAGEYSAKATFTVNDPTNYNVPTQKTLDWTIEAKKVVEKTTPDVSGVVWTYTQGSSVNDYSGNNLPYNSTEYVIGVRNLPEGIEATVGGTYKATAAGTYTANVTYTVKAGYEELYNAPSGKSITWTIETISKQQLTLNGVTVANGQYDGSQKKGYTGTPQWSNQSGNVSVETTVTYKKADGTVLGSAPTDAGTYMVVFTVNENNTYTGTKTITFTISKKDVDMSGLGWSLDGATISNVNNVKVTYDGNAHEIDVLNCPNQVTASRSNYRKSTVGTYTTVVTFTVKDEYKNNYNTPADKMLTWTIEAAPEEEEEDTRIDLDTSSTYWVYQQGGTTNKYVVGTTKLVENGSTYTVQIENLPEGASVVGYEGTDSASKAGTYTVKVTFGTTDATKYKTPSPATKTLTWTIEKQVSEGGVGDKEVEPDDNDNNITTPEKNEVTNKVGDTEPVSGGNYKVVATSTTGGTVTYTGPTKKSVTKVTIKSTIKMKDGKTYKVTSIAKNAFKGCTKLKNVTIPNSITSIGVGAFSGCKKLTTVKMGTGVKKIGDKAFYKCTALKKITISKNVTHIGKSCFEGCKNLKTITIKSKSLKKVGKKAIKGIQKKATIKCPNKSCASKYKKKLFKSNTGYKKTMKIK